MLKKFFAVLLLSYAVMAQAGFLGGNKLVSDMRSFEVATVGGSNVTTVQYLEATSFRSYVTGVADLGDGILFCLPSKSTNEQIGAVVAAFLKANPARWSEAANRLVMDALAQSFPCKK